MRVRCLGVGLPPSATPAAAATGGLPAARTGLLTLAFLRGGEVGLRCLFWRSQPMASRAEFARAAFLDVKIVEREPKVRGP